MNLHKSRIIRLCLLSPLLAFGTLAAAQTVGMEAVLATTRSDARVAAANGMPAFARSLNYRLPLIRKAELRIGTNGNAFRDTLYGDIRNEDFYGLVISPNSLREKRRQQAIQQAQVEVYETEARLVWQEAVLERYEALEKLYYSRRLYEARSNLDSLLAVKQRLLLQMLDQGVDVKVKEIVDTENDRNSLQSGMSESEKTMQLETSRIQSFLTSHQPLSPDELQFDSFITPDLIDSLITGYAKNPPIDLSYDYRVSRIGLAKKELDLENAKDRQIFSFFQIGYELPIVIERTPTRLNPNNNFSVRIGLTMPLPGNNNLNRSEAALDLREADNEARIARQQTEINVESQRARLESLLRSLRNMRDKTATSVIGKLINADKVSLELSPLELVELYVAQRKRELRALETEAEIVEEYLVFLEYSGYLGTFPERNYLSATLRAF